MTREWIIQRCTQRWIGTELVYEDWLGAVGPIIGAAVHDDLMTYYEMLRALEVCAASYPDDEFRGHRVTS